MDVGLSWSFSPNCWTSLFCFLGFHPLLILQSIMISSNSHPMWWAKSQRNSQDGLLRVRSISVLCFHATFSGSNDPTYSYCRSWVQYGSIRWKIHFSKASIQIYTILTVYDCIYVCFLEKTYMNYIYESYMFIVFMWVFSYMFLYDLAGSPSFFRSRQVDALEDQKDRLTNGLEKLRATSEQVRFLKEKAIPIGSMVLLYMVTWIPSIYPLYVSIYTSTMDPSWDWKLSINIYKIL